MSVVRLTNPRRISAAGIASATGTYSVHPEASDWNARVVANGGSVSYATILAMSQFCRSIDAESGLRAAILRLNLFCGNALNACLVPLYRAASLSASVIGNSTDVNNNFVSADFQETGSSGGLKGNGSTKFLNTGFAPNSFSSASSVHLSYSGTSLETTSNASDTSGDRFAIGTFANVEQSLFDMSIAAYITVANLRFSRLSTYSPVTVDSLSRGSAESHIIGTRTSLSAFNLYGGGSQLASSTATVSIATSAQPFYVFALNLNGSAGVRTAARLRMYSIGNGLTATQALAFSNAVSAFNTALGRA